MRAEAGLSRAALARVLETSPSNLSRSLAAGGFSRDLAVRVEMLLERGAAGMRNDAGKAHGNDPDPLQRALLLLLEFNKMVPDLERALVAVRRAANAEEIP